MSRDKSTKREEAEERQAEHDKLTPQQKIDKLDRKFGKGIGAKKERAKLQALIEDRNEHITKTTGNK